MITVADAQVATVSNLTNAANSILMWAVPFFSLGFELTDYDSPPFAFYSRKPVVFLSSPTRQELTDAAEKGDMPRGDKHEDALDRHVEDVLARPSKVRRTLRGLWSFLKTRTSYNTTLLSLYLISH